MKNQIPFFTETQDVFRKINDERNKALRNMFGKFIKPNFMIKIKEEIKTMPEFCEILSQCYNFSINPIFALGADDIDFDICLNLAFINHYLMLSISNDEKLKSQKYKNNDYIINLKSRTILQCKLRQLFDNEKRNIFSAHLPINFSMHCVVNFLLNRIYANIKHKNRSTAPNATFKINMLIVMLKTIRSILVLTEYDDCGSAFSLLRTLIETIFVYFAIDDNESVANEYYKFMGYRELYESTGQYPEEFERIVPLSCNKQNFLNYGWLDKLNNKHHKYVFSEVISSNKKVNKDEKNLYLTSYKYCCKYAHGNYLNQCIPSHSFIWILGKSGTILINIIKQFSHIFQEKTIYNGIALEKYLTEHVEEAVKIFNILQDALNNNAS